MAVDKRVAQRKLDEMLKGLYGPRRALALCRDKGDAFGEARCERLLKANYSLIRKHCARHDLELPHDVPSEGAE